MGMFIPENFRKTLPDYCMECGKPLDDDIHKDTSENGHDPVFFCKNIECFCGLCEQAFMDFEDEMSESDEEEDFFDDYKPIPEVKSADSSQD